MFDFFQNLTKLLNLTFIVRKFFMEKLICLLLVCCLLVGCATSSGNIAASYTSPVQYENYNCIQLAQETARLQQRITQLGGRLDEASRNDKVLTGVAVVVFWPALFALGGTKEQEAQFAMLKGQYEAVQQMSIQKGCSS